MGVSYSSGVLGVKPQGQAWSQGFSPSSRLADSSSMGGSWRVVSHPFPDGGAEVQMVSPACLACGVHR